MLNGLSLFSGIGGLDVALSEFVRPIAYCEIDPYCQGVLLSRMASGDLVHAPIWNDIKTLRIRPQEIDIDIIYGGFPCQDISIAGNGRGLEGERSRLFFEIVRLAKEIQPKFIFLENVPAITSRGGLRVVREIAKMGYDCRWCIISAASVGALHLRERWFLLAHALHNGLSSCEIGESARKIPSERRKQQCQKDFGKIERTSCISEDVANARCKCERSSEKPKWPSLHFAGCCRFWETEPKLDRMVDGIQFRVERTKALGNAVVPAQAREAFKILSGIKEP